MMIKMKSTKEKKSPTQGHRRMKDERREKGHLTRALMRMKRLLAAALPDPGAATGDNPTCLLPERQEHCIVLLRNYHVSQ
jgi:hypothetical protein